MTRLISEYNPTEVDYFVPKSTIVEESFGQLDSVTNDHAALREMAGQAIGAIRPIAFTADTLVKFMLAESKRRQLVPINDMLVRSWDRSQGIMFGQVAIGIQVYELGGIKFAYVSARYDHNTAIEFLCFFVVNAANYTKLFKLALQAKKRREPYTAPPTMPDEQFQQLWRNTIGFLSDRNINTIKKYGGRARRGLILSGSPGNGKTMSCRWLWSECRRRRWDWRIVTPDAYETKRAQKDVYSLFDVRRRGIIFFDDMDVALRDRDKVGEGVDQSIFLTALDGIQASEGVVFVFTTNCNLDLIDRAFKRPGRIDVVMEMKPPNQELREDYFKTWHEDILKHINVANAVVATEGYSYAELAELRNLMVMNFVEHGKWDLQIAAAMFAQNRDDFRKELDKRIGFGYSGGPTAFANTSATDPACDEEELFEEELDGDCNENVLD